MLRHYDYSTSLGHFLSRHRFDAPPDDDDGGGRTSAAACANAADAHAGHQQHSTSFTIAAILGLGGERRPAPGDAAVVNLSAHRHRQPGGGGGHASRLGVRGSSAAAAAAKKSCKSKRVRTIFTPEQLERLEAEFERQQYMVGPERLYLAHTLQLTEAQVKVWFQNRRIKWRKHHLELTHQRLAVLKQQQILMEEAAHAPDAHDANTSGSET